MSPLSHIEAQIEALSLLKHPFYQLWNKGELTLDELRTYAKEYWHLVKRVPSIVDRVLIRAEAKRPDLVARIQENVMEEREHIALWERFARSLDLTREDLEAYEPSQKTESAVRGLECLAEGSLEDGVTVMYAMEREIPAIARSKKEGLVRYYNLTSEDAHCYFDAHLDEAKHFEAWLTVPVEAERAREVTEEALKLQHGILDGVCEECGICTHERASY